MTTPLLERPPAPTSVLPPTNREAFTRLGIVLAIGVGAAIVLHAVAVLVVVLALVAMVMLHELGHFLAAKISGMQVTEYFFGFGPRVWSVRRGETEYGVKAIPAGGYVRITGMTMIEQVDPENEARSYRQATFPRRLFVAVAGSAMHFLIAFGLLWGIVAFAGLPVATSVQVSKLAALSNGADPARAAGVHVGDVLVSVDGHHYVNPESFVDFIRDHAGANVALVVRRAGRDVTLHLRPKPDTSGGVTKNPPGKIGVELTFNEKNETSNPLISLQRAGTLLGQVVSETIGGITNVFSVHGLTQSAHQVATAGRQHNGSSAVGTSAQNGQLLSIIGAIQIGVQAAQQNISELLIILVSINIFVGMINLFPMLPLDGGHVVIAVYERIRSRHGRRYHADVRKLMPVAYVFLALILVIGLSALYVNIVQPATLPGG